MTTITRQTALGRMARRLKALRCGKLRAEALLLLRHPDGSVELLQAAAVEGRGPRPAEESLDYARHVLRVGEPRPVPEDFH